MAHKIVLPKKRQSSANSSIAAFDSSRKASNNMVDRGTFINVQQSGLGFIDDRVLSFAPVEGMTPLPLDFKPNEYTVICGRGKECFNHVGNRRFRLLCDLNLEKYEKAKSKIEKTLIVSSIIEAIRESKAKCAGGFVKQDPETKRWYEVGDAVAREKVGQQLRENLTRKNPAKLEARKHQRKTKARRSRSFDASNVEEKLAFDASSFGSLSSSLSDSYPILKAGGAAKRVPMISTVRFASEGDPPKKKRAPKTSTSDPYPMRMNPNLFELDPTAIASMNTHAFDLNPRPIATASMMNHTSSGVAYPRIYQSAPRKMANPIIMPPQYSAVKQMANIKQLMGPTNLTMSNTLPVRATESSSYGLPAGSAIGSSATSGIGAPAPVSLLPETTNQHPRDSHPPTTILCAQPCTEFNDSTPQTAASNDALTKAVPNNPQAAQSQEPQERRCSYEDSLFDMGFFPLPPNFDEQISQDSFAFPFSDDDNSVQDVLANEEQQQK